MIELRCVECVGGVHEKRLLNDLLGNHSHYNRLERPVANESDALAVTFGLVLQQIIDVVVAAAAAAAAAVVINNNNNSHYNVYGAVIMTKVIARVHPVHLMNAD